MSGEQATGALPKLYDRRIQQIMRLLERFPEPRKGFTKEEHIVQITVMFCDEFDKKVQEMGIEL